jgi:glutaredoxin 3
MAIEIYSKNNCSFCEQAKQLLRIHKKDFVEYKLDEDFTREILLSKFPEAKSYPVVVVDGFHIGGFHQLQQQINEQTNDTRKVLLETDSYYGA